MGLTFGLSKQNITPDFPTCLACSQQKDTLFERIHDNIFVRCSILNNDGHYVLIISYDLLFHSRDLYNFVYDYISGRLDIGMPDILINYTHDHNAPSVMGYNNFSASPEYEELLKRKTAECIDDALAEMEPGIMEYGIIEGDWNINRRRPSPDGIILAPNPGGPRDKNIYVLKLISGTAKIKGLIINYACHPVHYPDTLGLTSEYPGYLCRYIEEELKGCTPLFLQGAGADVRPLGTAEGSRFAHRSFEFIKSMAASMKDSLMSVLDTPLFRPIEPSFASVSFSVEVPTADEGRQYFQQNKLNINLSGHLRRNAESIYTNYDSIKESFTLHCGIIKLSDNLVIAHMGGEPVCGVKFEIEKSLIGYDVIFTGYTDVCAYIVTDSMIDEDGYEVQCFLEYMHKGRIKKGIDSILTTAFSNALNRL